MFVDETADLKLAIPAIVFGAVCTAGQRCNSTRLVFIHESIFFDVLAKLVTAYGQVEKKIGDPTDPANLMGPLNSSNRAMTVVGSRANRHNRRNSQPSSPPPPLAETSVSSRRFVLNMRKAGGPHQSGHHANRCGCV